MDWTQNTDGNYTASTNTNWTKVASGISSVAAGATHSMRVTSEGSLCVVGQDTCGQLGLGNSTTSGWSAIPEA